MELKDQMYVTVHGSNRVDLVTRLRAAADNLDGMPAEATTGRVTTTKATTAKSSKKTAAAPPAEEEDDNGFVTEAASNGFDDEDAGEVQAAAEAGFDEEPPAKATAKGKATKPKKLTLDDLNDICKAHAAAKGRPATLAILQKKFKTQSVTALKPEQYQAVAEAMSL